MKRSIVRLSILVCFLVWLVGLGNRLFNIAFSAEPMKALFHPEEIEIIYNGYGSYARIRTFLSLFDVRFLLFMILSIIGLLLSAKERKRTEKSERELESLKERMQVQINMLKSQEKDVETIEKEKENFAHQLKSSLNSLALRLEMMDVYEEVEESLNHMNAQIDRCLKKGKIHHNDLQLHMEIISIKEILEKEILPEVDGYDVAIATRLYTPGWLYGDGALLEQAMETLLVNACRHGRHIQIELMEENNIIKLIIENETEETAVPSMKRYETKDSGHYGIGLDLARNAISLHGGDLSLTIEKGVFKTTIQIPVHPWESADAIFQKDLSDSMISEVK